MIKKWIINKFKKLQESPSKELFSTALYWEKRYQTGGHSGLGSFNRLAEFKSEIINKFILENRIESVIEFGCGDGNILTHLKFPKYIGLDVSESAIKKCSEIYKNDKSKTFIYFKPEFFYDNAKIFESDLALSLDVIYHLIEDEMFYRYMTLLFSSAKKYVIIYSSNKKVNSPKVKHVKHRVFSEWIKINKPNWHLKKTIINKYPYVQNVEGTSSSDFYIYEFSQ